MGKIFTTLVFVIFVFISDFAQAFEFDFPLEGEIVTAGTTLQAKINLGDFPIPFGVLFSAPQGISSTKLDSTAPFKWTLKIPADYYGPLTLWAVVRRYVPIAYSPSTSVTVFVIRPALKLSLSSSGFF
ncbi:MAG: hypothetical protein VST69_06130 [Nitrospirota bacterium]|nr:hypothetical protein [Nitrospirota bacterium]